VLSKLTIATATRIQCCFYCSLPDGLFNDTFIWRGYLELNEEVWQYVLDWNEWGGVTRGLFLIRTLDLAVGNYKVIY